MRLLHSVPFKAGFENNAILESLKQSVQKLEPKDRHCILVFDEMALQPSLFYDKNGECLIGFEDYGVINNDYRGLKIADQAMAFMLRGLHKAWKQPISFYFAQNGMSNSAIAKHLRIAISELLKIGLVVEATICDQYNKPAINTLVEDTAAQMGYRHESYSFIIDGNEILPLYDFPHLLKGIRNNMLNYDIKFQSKNGVEVASWQHIEDAYDLDEHVDEDFKLFHKLTKEHVKREKIKKMKVKFAAQVFSHRVQSTIRTLVTYGKDVLPPEALGTANFCLFMNKLFDSVNGSAVTPKDGNPLRRAVRNNTQHCAFWEEAINVFQNATFIRPGQGDYVPPTVTNWIISLSNLRALWERLKGVGFDFLLTRACNQDCIENLFGRIRSYGVRDINPSCKAFTSSFKSLIINNFMAYHSPSANCEEDEHDGPLDSLRTFLRTRQEDNEEVSISYASGKIAILTSVNDKKVLALYGHLAGYVAKTILNQISTCRVCRRELVSPLVAEEHSLIQERAYTYRALLRPRTKFVVLFGLCVQVCRQWLPKIANEKKLPTKLSLIILQNVQKDIFSVCPQHDLFKKFVKIFVNIYLYTYANNINKIVKGKVGVHRLSTDPIKQQAVKLHQKHKAKAKKIREIKALQL